MILVTVGSTVNDFSRLLEAVDDLVLRGAAEDVFAQIGRSRYEPKHCEWTRFMPKNDLEERMRKAEFVICHAGTGTLNQALGLGKKVIVTPRLLEYREHPDDHQVELARYLAARGRAIMVMDMHDLDDAVRRISVWQPRNKEEESADGIIREIELFIEKMRCTE